MICTMNMMKASWRHHGKSKLKTSTHSARGCLSRCYNTILIVDSILATTACVTVHNKKKTNEEVSDREGKCLSTSAKPKRDQGRPGKSMLTPAHVTYQMDVITQDHLKDHSQGRDVRLYGNDTTLIWHTKINIYERHGGPCACCSMNCVSSV
jgi:hypothetical protein